MIDPKHILSLDEKERDDEIRALIGLEHKFKAGRCCKCGCLYGQSGSSSPCPDPIALDANLAMEMRDEVGGPDVNQWHEAKISVFNARVPQAEIYKKDKSKQLNIASRYFADSANEIDIIIAALLAGEGADNAK